MSQDSTSPRQQMVILDTEQVIDDWVVSGGLDLKRIKSEELVKGELRNLYYSFVTSDGFSVEARLYWVIEDNNPRQYIWVECAFGELSDQPNDGFRHLLKRSREIPAAFKLGISEDLAVFCVRGPVDGFIFDHLKELIEGLIPCAQTLYQEAKDAFDMPTWAEARQNKNLKRIH